MNEYITEEETARRCMLRLQHAVQALAQPAKIQLELFPDFVCKVDELSLDFDNWWLCIRSREGLVTSQQRSLLAEIDEQLDRMSGKENSELWTEDALRENPWWEHIRDLARKTLSAFGWANEVPPS
jgi:hypothetical protein